MEPNEIISSGILEAYATGMASPQEVIQVKGYLNNFVEVREELDRIEADLEIYANLFAVQPDAAVKNKIFARINVDDKRNNEIENGSISQASRAVIGIPIYWKYIAAASIVLLLGSIILNLLLYNKNQDFANNFDHSQKEIFALKEDNQLLNSDMQVVQNKYSKPVSLHGLDASPDAAAKIFYIENTGEVYIDPSNLPDAPQGKQYQLWGIVNGKPVDAGMILTTKKGDKYRIQKMKSFGKAEAFAVTLENEKGNTSPKGPMFVMGKM